ncbi:hypothetical protein BYT27DRAFT_7339947 [Phlegmacium glaucopus]|nr:hypothetical protein BYT27DRAFT_7339947 [Phlegmacium glaucopus]
MGAESGFWLGARDTPGPARKHILGWALGHSGYHLNTSQKLSFLAGHSGYHPNTDQNKWFWLPVGVQDTTQRPARTHISWAVLRISSKTSQKTHSGWAFGHLGYHPNTSQNLSFLAGHSGYHPNTNQKRRFWLGIWDTTQQPARADIFWLVLGILSKNQPENTVWAGRSGYHLNTSQKTCSGWVFRISPENQPENVFSGRCSGYYLKNSKKTCSGWHSGDLVRSSPLMGALVTVLHNSSGLIGWPQLMYIQ